MTVGIRARTEVFNSMVLSSVDPGAESLSLSLRSCTVTDDAVVLEAVCIPPDRTGCRLLASSA